MTRSAFARSLVIVVYKVLLNVDLDGLSESEVLLTLASRVLEISVTLDICTLGVIHVVEHVVEMS